MENPRPEKVAVVDEVREKFASAEAVLLTEYRGLNVAALAQLRHTLRDAGGEYKVYKNTLVRLAVADMDVELDDLLVGPTAIAFVGERPDGTPGDAVLVAKALQGFARQHPQLLVKGGVLGGRLLDGDSARALATVAPREELLARLAGGFAAPMQKFAGLLAALPRNFAYGLKALLEERGGVPEPAEAPEAPEAPEVAEASGGGDEMSPGTEDNDGQGGAGDSEASGGGDVMSPGTEDNDGQGGAGDSEASGGGDVMSPGTEEQTEAPEAETTEEES